MHRAGAGAKVGHPAKGAIWLKVNGKITQNGDLAELIWNIPETISYLSGLITLQPGDLIYSGTPAGVGPVKAGDKLEGHVDGVGDLTVTYAIIRNVRGFNGITPITAITASLFACH